MRAFACTFTLFASICCSFTEAKDTSAVTLLQIKTVSNQTSAKEDEDGVNSLASPLQLVEECKPSSWKPGRCGPWYGGRCSQAHHPWCNTNNGWCGSTSAHRDAQNGDTYDFDAQACNRGFGWKVVTGSCKIDPAGCVSSPGGSLYPNDDGCKIKVLNEGATIVEGFHTENNHDKLTINGQEYSGTSRFHSSLIPTGEITWTSDYSDRKKGWKLCPQVCRATVYQHGDFTGWSATFLPGSYNHGAATHEGLVDDDMSSIKVTPGCRVLVYQHDDFTGWSAAFWPGSYNHDLAVRNGLVNDDASSIKVEETCSWSLAYGKYSPGYADGSSGQNYADVDEMKALCISLGSRRCKAVTCKGSSCRTGASAKLNGSPSGERTYTPSSGCFGAYPTSLQVQILAASNLQPQSWELWETPDLWVELEIAGQRRSRITTGTQRDTHNPIWNEKFHFPEYQPGDKLVFTVWDEDAHYHDKMGTVEYVHDCERTGSRDLKLHPQGSLTVRVECVPGTDSFMESMVHMASAAYADGAPPEDWETVETIGDADILKVFQKNKECVVAFSGTNDFADVITDVAAVPTPQCGYWMHLGFYNEVKRYINTTDFSQKVVPFLASDQCSGGIYAVGHSLGGAVAEIFTVCVNQREDWIPGNPFDVKEVYTIGAPAVALSPLKQNGGCLNGARFYNEDEETYDPIAFVAQLAGFEHPNLRAVQLISSSDKVVGRELDCMSQEAVEGNRAFSARSAIKDLKRVARDMKAELEKKLELHFRVTYMERAQRLLKLRPW